MSKKINLNALANLRDKGLTGRQIAEHLGVTEGAISKALKKLNFAGRQDVVLRTVERINDSKLDAMGQLQKINSAITDELGRIQEQLQIATKDERPDLQEMQIKHTAEIRKQLSLLLEISKTLYNAQEIEEFKRITLEEIGAENVEVRNRILERLRQRRSAGQSVSFSGSRI